MWLYVPPTSNCAPELAESQSSSGDLEPSLFVALSGTATRRPFSWRGWKTRPWAARLFGTISRPSMAAHGVAAWISSLRDSRASRSPSPANDVATTTSARSGRKSSASLASASRRSCSSRMSSQRLFDDPSLDFADWVSSSLRYSELPRRMSGRHIDECDASLWPTATAQDSGSSGSSNYSTASGRHTGTTLTDAMRAWPTPCAHDGRRPRDETSSQGANLAKDAAKWSTPKSSDAAKAGPNMRGSKGDTPLPGQVAKWQTPSTADANGTHATRGGERSGELLLPGQAMRWATPDASVSTGYNQSESRGAAIRPTLGRQVRQTPMVGADGSQRAVLNPAFVEALMGFPRDWTACDASETPSSHLKPKPLSGS